MLQTPDPLGQVKSERSVLASVAGHPFITTMVASFQDQDSLYMIV